MSSSTRRWAARHAPAIAPEYASGALRQLVDAGELDGRPWQRVHAGRVPTRLPRGASRAQLLAVASQQAATADAFAMWRANARHNGVPAELWRGIARELDGRLMPRVLTPFAVLLIVALFLRVPIPLEAVDATADARSVPPDPPPPHAHRLIIRPVAPRAPGALARSARA